MPLAAISFANATHSQTPNLPFTKLVTEHLAQNSNRNNGLLQASKNKDTSSLLKRFSSNGHRRIIFILTKSELYVEGKLIFHRLPADL